jgi:hypothetical protein
VQEADDSWSVADVETALAYRISDFPMVLLREEIARSLAEILNNLDRLEQTIH